MQANLSCYIPTNYTSMFPVDLLEHIGNSPLLIASPILTTLTNRVTVWYDIDNLSTTILDIKKILKIQEKIESPLENMAIIMSGQILDDNCLMSSIKEKLRGIENINLVILEPK